MNKPALALLSLLITISSFAEVKPIGTPVPYLCGKQVSSNDTVATDVVRATGGCRAHLSGMGKEAITISFNDKSRQVWTIVASEPAPVTMESQNSAFDLTLVLQSNTTELVTTKARLDVDRTGMTKRISGTTPGGVEFDIQSFEHVFTTMGF